MAAKRILFVCVHNSGRSQMAEAYLNHLATIDQLPFEGLSAGTMAGAGINPLAIQAMAEIGVDMAGQHPKQLTPEMVAKADKVITMGCGVESDACPAGTYISEDWGLDDPAGQGIEEVRRIRDQVVAKVRDLVHRVEVTS